MKAKNQTSVPHDEEHEAAVFGEAATFEGVRVELSSGPSHEEIQQRAYEIHLERGAIHGQDLEDWLQAEAEMKAKYPVG